MNRKAIVISLFLIMGFVGIANATVVTIQPDATEGKDTWVWDIEDWSHGSWGEMRVNDTSSWLQYGLIQFDVSLIPSNAVITSANLYLYKYDGFYDEYYYDFYEDYYYYDYGSLIVDAHQVTSDWTEDVTWSTRPGFNTTAEASVTISYLGWYSWGITSLAQGWVDGSINNYGVALYDHGTSYFQSFVTSDNSTATDPDWALPPTESEYRPYLVIEYTVPTAVSLVSFNAASNGYDSVTLTWETATEVNNAGFNIYRAKRKDGNYKKINAELIDPKGSETEGASYSYEDTPPASGTYYYKLEDVEYGGSTTMHGPVKARVK